MSGPEYALRLSEVEAENARLRAESEGRRATLVAVGEERAREWKRADRAEAESSRLSREAEALRAGLRTVTEGMDRAGGDRDGMPECPWCHREDPGTDDMPETERHDADCELVAARRALSGGGDASGGGTGP